MRFPHLVLFARFLPVFTFAAALSAAGCGGDDVPTKYKTVCETQGLDCATGTSPPDLAGHYTGTGTTLQTSSALWGVGNSAMFEVTIDESNGDISGNIKVGDFSLDVKSGSVDGSGDTFTVFGSGSYSQDGCSVTADVVITGTTDGGKISGKLALQLTSATGSGCAGDTSSGRPAVKADTGASFSYMGTKDVSSTP